MLCTYLYGYDVCLYTAIGELCYSVKGVPMFLVFVCQNTRHATKEFKVVFKDFYCTL